MNYGFPIRPKGKTGKTEKHCGTSNCSRQHQKKNPKNPRANAECFSGFSISDFISCQAESSQPCGFSVFRVFRLGCPRGWALITVQLEGGGAGQKSITQSTLDRPVRKVFMGRFPRGGRGQLDCTRWHERLRKSLSRWQSARCTNSAQRRHADGDKFSQGSKSSSAWFAGAGGRA